MLPGNALEFGANDALDVKLLQGSLTAALTRHALADFYDNCDAIVALNGSALEAFRSFGYGGRVFVIPNGRDLRAYGRCALANVAAPNKTLTFVGYISPRKNQAYLQDVLAHLAGSYRLQLIGTPLNPRYARELASQRRRLGLDNVILLGQVPHEKIQQHLERSHVFVSASRMEVQSLVVIEALASGTPVVGLSNETIDELVDDGVGRRLPRDASPESFARCVESICGRPQGEYDRLCRNARERVAQLDWQDVAAETVEAYQVLAREKKPIAVSVAVPALGHARATSMERVKLSADEPALGAEPLLGLGLLARLRAWARVAGTTWLLAGLTMIGSQVGYWLCRNRQGLAAQGHPVP